MQSFRDARQREPGIQAAVSLQKKFGCHRPA
jgi:hypothetical protein